MDLDWEFPVQSDTANLISLVREMRAAFGDKYGISLAL